MTENLPDIYKEHLNFPLAKKSTEIEFLNQKLKHGQFDIHYVIKLLRIINDQCIKHQLNPGELRFTLIHSLKKMIAMLEVERDNP